MKFPERLIYGLLRNYGRHSSIDTKILIEEATEYKKSNVKLRKQLPKQLNMQAIYRGENFKVTHSDYKTKGEAIGLEMTDILLGIVRTIIKNPPFISRKQKAHIQLITYFLKDTRFYDFMKRLNYYEWTSSRQLTGVDFSNYLELFIVTNYELYLED